MMLRVGASHPWLCLVFRRVLGGSYCDIAAALGFMLADEEEKWRRTTLQVASTPTSSLTAAAMVLAAKTVPAVVRGDGSVSSPSHGIRSSFVPTLPEKLVELHSTATALVAAGVRAAHVVIAHVMARCLLGCVETSPVCGHCRG